MRFGLPRELATWLALAVAGAALLCAARLARRAERRSAPPDASPLAAGPRRAAAPALFVAAAALAAALLSAAYVAAYLRGGPRIIDATSYWLEARALAEGHLAWPLDEPATSVLGRFLVRSEGPPPAGSPRVAVLFPPGYPAVLALGFLLGAPLAVGPLLAALLTIATYALAARLDGEAGTKASLPSGLPFTPTLAVIFSVTCAALRYHTADTMSHGLAALCFTAALLFACSALDRAAAPSAPGPALRSAAACGLAAGWLAATRPPSGLALGATLLLLLLRWAPPAGRAAPSRRARLGLAAAIALGALPGLVLLAAHQRAATAAWASSQQAYYAVSDGPPGCFRYGFGAGIGCLGEHGDFVRHNLAHGYGFLAAAGTTLRRLKLHLVDPLNAEPLMLAVVAGLALALRRPRARLLALAPFFQIAAYVPFYFDGNYPGGGARFFADILPIEHALAALAIAALARRRLGPGGAPAPSWIFLAVALPLAGFAMRAGFDHALLRDREGGLPMFDAALVARAGVTRGLVFVDTDHGFNLGFDPEAKTVQVARYHGDALDRMAWEARGRPPAFRYRFAIPESGGAAAVSIEPLSLEASARRPAEDLIEGESLWPPLAQRGAWALPHHAGGTCASGSRVLAIHAATHGGEGMVRIGLPAPWLQGVDLSPRIATEGDASGSIRLLVDGVEIHTWRIAPGARGAALACRALEPRRIPEAAARVELELARAEAQPLDAPGASGAPRKRPMVSIAPAAPNGLFALDALWVAGGKSVDW